MMGIEKSLRRLVVCEATTPGKKPDSAQKRARQAEKRRIYNKSKKSEIKTRMKKVSIPPPPYREWVFFFFPCYHLTPWKTTEMLKRKRRKYSC